MAIEIHINTKALDQISSDTMDALMEMVNAASTQLAKGYINAAEAIRRFDTTIYYQDYRITTA